LPRLQYNVALIREREHALYCMYADRALFLYNTQSDRLLEEDHTHDIVLAAWCNCKRQVHRTL